jgi:hypothetical protein
LDAYELAAIYRIDKAGQFIATIVPNGCFSLDSRLTVGLRETLDFAEFVEVLWANCQPVSLEFRERLRPKCRAREALSLPTDRCLVETAAGLVSKCSTSAARYAASPSDDYAVSGNLYDP